MSEVTLTDATWKSEVLEAKLPVLVDFWAPWCGPCRMIAPIVEEIARDYAGRLKVGKVNVDENPEISRAYHIQSIPTLMIFKNGQIAERVVGALPRPMLEKAITPHVASAAA